MWKRGSPPKGMAESFLGSSWIEHESGNTLLLPNDVIMDVGASPEDGAVALQESANLFLLTLRSNLSTMQAMIDVLKMQIQANARTLQATF